MADELNTEKYGAVINVSDEMLTESRGMWASLLAYQAMPEQERKAAAEAAARERARVRAVAQRVPLTLDVLLDKLGWDHEFAEHFVQLYCECSDGIDGFTTCQHWRDVHPDA